MERSEVLRLERIGFIGECGEEQLKYFLPNYPSLHGSEFIFKIRLNKITSVDSSIDFIINVIKGLHLIEREYCKTQNVNYKYGFGSPSRTCQLIADFKKKNPEIAEKLKNWISENGGNYYIKPDEKES